MFGDDDNVADEDGHGDKAYDNGDSDGIGDGDDDYDFLVALRIDAVDMSLHRLLICG